MSLTMPEPSSGGDFTPPPEGTHPARCYRVVDLGTQRVEHKGEVKHQHKILISWEMPTELMDDDRPFTIHKRYTYSSHEKSNLRKDLEAWRGQRFQDSDFGPNGFHLRNLLGVGCLVIVVHNTNGGTTYGNLGGVARLPKGMEVAQPVNPEVLLSLDKAEFDRAIYDTLSDGLKATIALSPEYQELVKTDPQAPVDGGALPGNGGTDGDPFADVPF